MTSPETMAADTFGWDTVFALQVDDLNAAIARGESSPRQFSQTDNGSTASGTFGDWQIYPGGDGKRVKLRLPIRTGTLTMGTKKVDMANWAAIVEVSLAFFEHTGPPAPGASGTYHSLRASKQEPVQVMSVTAPRLLEKATLLPLLNQWLNEHLESFDHVFATVNLNRVAANGRYQWLFPTTVGYAYIDKSPPETSLLAVMCQTAGRPAPSLRHQLTPGAVPANCRAGFLLSRTRVLADMVLPVLPRAFPGTGPSDFELAPDGAAITLSKAGTGRRVTMRDGKGKPYDVRLQVVNISIQAGQVMLQSECLADVSPGIRAHTRTVHRYAVDLSDNSQQLRFQEVGTPVVDHWTTDSGGIKILKVVLKVVALVVALVVGIVVTFMTAGVVFIIGVVLVALLAGVLAAVAEIPAMIEATNTAAAGDINLLVLNTTDPIRWDDTKDFRLVSAQLNESLQLGGIFSPKPSA